MGHIRLQPLSLQQLAPTLIDWYRDTGDSIQRRYIINRLVEGLNAGGADLDVRIVSAWLRDKPRVGRSPALRELNIIAEVLDSYAEIPYGTDQLNANLKISLEGPAA